MEWGDGGIEKDSTRTWSDVLQIIDRNVVGESGLMGDFAEAERAADEAFPRLKREALAEATRAAMERPAPGAIAEAEAEVAAQEAEGAFDIAAADQMPADTAAGSTPRANGTDG